MEETMQTLVTTSKLPPSPPNHWASYMTLDFFAYILQRSLFHPFICFLIPLSLLALHHPFSSTGVRYTCLWFCVVGMWRTAAVWNHRLAYGRARKVDVEEEVVLVAGGWGKTGGLGRLFAEVYAMRGARGVVVLDQHVPDEDSEEREEWEERDVKFCKCDVGNREDLERIREEVSKEFDTYPTILINCAAAPIVSGSLTSITTSQFERTLNTNLSSQFNLISVFLPSILDPSNVNGGTIVSLSSTLSHFAPAHVGPYSASKAALSSLHNTLTAEMRNLGIGHKVKTILVETGQINTSLFAGVETPNPFFAPVLDTREVCKAVTTLIDAGEGGVVRLPTYASWAAWYGIIPVSVQRMLRWASGVDAAMGKRDETSSKVVDSPGISKSKGVGDGGSTSGDDVVLVEKL